ncbi:MAG: deoxynucleoside kinase [Candidatus Babeliales bacterium]
MYIVEGNIGAGKSTFLQLIKKRLPEIMVALEPLHNWQKDIHGQSLLANFYKNPQRWAFSIETFTMICRMREHQKDQNNLEPNFIVERSIYSGHYCFALNGYKNGALSNLEWEIYNSLFNLLIPGKCKLPKGFIYLRTNPETVYQRIQKRNRSGENIIPLTYLEQIHQHHEAFLIEKKNILPELQNIPVLILDVNDDFEMNKELLNQHIEALQLFCNKK